MALIQPGRTVRPWLRRVAIAACIVLTPIAIWTAWDYVEARRLAAVVKAVKARGEPVSTVRPAPEGLSAADNAARYYDAAAALVDTTGLSGPTGLLNRIDGARGNEASVATDIAAFLEANTEAEGLLSKATDLPFNGERPGFDFNYRAAQLYELARLADLRALDRVIAKDGEGAARAIVEQLRLLRPLGWREQFTNFTPFAAYVASRASAQVSSVLASGISGSSLERLQQRLQEPDIDSAIELQVLQERAVLLQSFWNDARSWYTRTYPLRPLVAHRVVEQAELLNEFLLQARRPWPQRLDIDAPSEAEIADRRRRPGRLLLFPLDLGDPDIARYAHKRRTEATASSLALVRSALAATAVARFRLAHAGELPRTLEELVPAFLPNVPVDPYSGKPLRYAHDGAHFAIYSDGTNQRDDGGKDLNATSGRRWGVYSVTSAPLDIGVEVSTAPAGAVVPVSPPISAPGRR
jgi:hypothetical protein